MSGKFFFSSQLDHKTDCYCYHRDNFSGILKSADSTVILTKAMDLKSELNSIHYRGNDNFVKYSVYVLRSRVTQLHLVNIVCFAGKYEK